MAEDSMGSMFGNSMRKLLVEDETHPSVYGVITVVVKEARKLYFEGSSTNMVNTYARISIRNLSKRTRVVLNQFGHVVWNQVKHFPVSVMRNRKHPFNLLHLQLFSFDGSCAHEHKEVASVAFHLHDVIKWSPIRGSFDLLSNHQNVGEIHLEVLFNYGLFGYGYSMQLKDDQKKSTDFLALSLFPRIEPPEDRIETDRITMTPKVMPHPVFLDFNKKAVLGYGTLVAGIEDENRQPRFEKLRHATKRYHELREHYSGINDRMDKLLFLHQTIMASNRRTEAVKDRDELKETQTSSKSYMNFVQSTISILSDRNAKEKKAIGES
eukprot:TRINITY_DN2059_c0_g1_i11.p1 TRINITY_DN2059_c0_g1~~TRINITY_DN2059_c0_g1_i11.p1  ORF type:complete len:324 (-),score=69.41 TRINITY_DN2059_c0_g1_i11:485-1456(-)